MTWCYTALNSQTFSDFFDIFADRSYFEIMRQFLAWWKYSIPRNLLKLLFSFYLLFLEKFVKQFIRFRFFGLKVFKNKVIFFNFFMWEVLYIIHEII